MSLVPSWGLGADDVGQGEGLSPAWGYGAGTGLLAAVRGAYIRSRGRVFALASAGRPWTLDASRVFRAVVDVGRSFYVVAGPRSFVARAYRSFRQLAMRVWRALSGD